MHSFVKISGMAIIGLSLGAAAASAGEVRLTDAELDSLTAGQDFAFAGNSSIQFGAGGTFEPVGPSFGGFDVLEGPLNPPSAPPPTFPATGGGDLGSLLSALLGILGNR